MMLLDRLRGFLGIDSGDPGEPQDLEENWPRGAGETARLFFPRPEDAVSSLEESLSQDPLDCRLVRRSLEALRMSSSEWKVRMATGGRVARLLIEALEADSSLVDQEALRAWADDLQEVYFQTSERLLILWARALGKAISKARGCREVQGRQERRTLAAGTPAPRPWMSRRSSDLSPALAYRLLLEDCLGDGHLTTRETRTLELVAILLEIPPGQHQAMIQEIENEVRSGSLRRDRPFEPRNYFQRVYFLARSGGKLSVESRELLVRLGNVLGITQEEFEEIRQRVAREGAVPRGSQPINVLR